MTDFSKDFFQTAWGKNGYYENFSYGVGIDRVCEVALYPFMSIHDKALEIGSGGGTFTQRMRFKHLTVVDVIKMPPHFAGYKNFTFIELPDKSYTLPGVTGEFDFCFSYNVFCHLSNEALIEYLRNIYRVMKPGGDFVFMLANYQHTKKHFLDIGYKLGDMTPIGHFYQDLRTLPLIVGNWKVIDPNMIPEHRDIIVHLRK